MSKYTPNGCIYGDAQLYYWRGSIGNRSEKIGPKNFRSVGKSGRSEKLISDRLEKQH